MQATLFSAVVTAFVIESYHDLQPDSGDSTVLLLQQILVTLQHNDSYDDLKPVPTTLQPFTPRPSAVRVNALWFASLVISISTAFLAILGKQWLLRITKELVPAEENRVRQHQFTHDGIQDWRLPHILSFLPMLLHASLLLFFAGLIEFLWPVNSTVAAVTAGLVAVTVFVYVFTQVASLIWPTCPFRTTFNVVFLAGLDWLLLESLSGLVTVLVLLMKPPYDLFRYLILGVKDKPSLFATVLLLRRFITSTWTTMISIYMSPEYRDNMCISQHADRLDVRAISRMISEFPQTEETNQLLGRELTRSNVVKNSGVFLSAGTVRLLAGQIRANYVAKYQELTPEKQDKVFRLSGTLAQLLTEVEGDDPRTLLLVDGVPLHIEVWDREDLSTTLTDIGICAADAELTDTDDLIFFSTMLRLQLYASSVDWFDKGIGQSVEKFQECLDSTDKWTRLPDDKLLLLVNTAIYVSTRPEGDRKEDDDDQDERVGQPVPKALVMTKIRPRAARTLNALATLLSRRPDLSFAIQRQICWGIWICSNPERSSRWDPLLPNLKKVGRLSKALANLMHSNPKYPHIPHILLVSLDVLLRSAPTSSDIDPAEREDMKQLRAVLVAQYPVFLEQFRTDIPHFLKRCRADHSSQTGEQTFFKRMLKRIVSISGYLAFRSSSHTFPNIDFAYIGHSTLSLLLYLCQHVGDIPESDRRDFWLVAYSTAAQMTQMTTLQSHRPPSTNDPSLETLADVSLPGMLANVSSPEMLADTIIAALQAASEAAEPPPAFKTLLSMIALLPRVQGVVGIDDLCSTVLSRLRNPDARSTELIAPMLDVGGYRDIAREALAAVQYTAEAMV